jgi:hypothetical protein
MSQFFQQISTPSIFGNFGNANPGANPGGFGGGFGAAPPQKQVSDYLDPTHDC